MSETEWRLLTTLTDLPSAHLLAELLAAEGIATRLVSDASLLGQAAPTRVFVSATQAYRAQTLMTQQQFSDEELEQLATGASGAPE
jgi:hypothetical protein